LLQGRTVSFRNALIIMTSNLGSADILAASRSAAAGGGADEAFSLLTRDRVMAQVGPWMRSADSA
jgi:ATP-dependent Clp protease ATP-binding subunit ClpA